MIQEQQLKKTKADGVMFLSGDVHYAEISKLKEELDSLADYGLNSRATLGSSALGTKS